MVTNKWLNHFSNSKHHALVLMCVWGPMIGGINSRHCYVPGEDITTWAKNHKEVHVLRASVHDEQCRPGGRYSYMWHAHDLSMWCHIAAMPPRACTTRSGFMWTWHVSSRWPRHITNSLTCSYLNTSKVNRFDNKFILSGLSMELGVVTGSTRGRDVEDWQQRCGMICRHGEREEARGGQGQSTESSSEGNGKWRGRVAGLGDGRRDGVVIVQSEEVQELDSDKDAKGSGGGKHSGWAHLCMFQEAAIGRV
jgi:hypothetical protein